MRVCLWCVCVCICTCSYEIFFSTIDGVISFAANMPFHWFCSLYKSVQVNPLTVTTVTVMMSICHQTGYSIREGYW